MKKNKLLTALVLSTTCLLSLASCKGEQGIKGDTGEKGDQGQKGDSGTPGKDGENGKDGASLLNGEGAPSDTLGNDGDTYIDSLTFDLYIKDNGKWILKGNTKGDKGDQGEKGDTGSKGDKGDTGSKGDKGNTGSSGSQGTKGDTAWSNTILYSEYGYITPSAASMIANNSNKISFTVHHNDYSNARFSKLILRNPKLSDDGELVISASDTEEFTTIAEDHDYTYETTMLEGGFVVSAEFVTKETVEIDVQNSNFNVSSGSVTECFVGDGVDLTITPKTSDYRLKADDNGKYYIYINGEKVEVTKTEGKYEYTCTVPMVKDGFTITDYSYEVKQSVEINNVDGGTITLADATKDKYFVGEDVTFKITPTNNQDDTYDLNEFLVDGSPVTVTKVPNSNYYTYTTTMKEGLSVSATWVRTYSMKADIKKGGSIEVYKLDSEGNVGDKVNYSSESFKEGDKIRVKFIPEEANTSTNTLKTRLYSVSDGASEIMAASIDESDGVKYKDYTFGTSNISLQVKFECIIDSKDGLMIFHNNSKYHSNAIITVDTTTNSFTSCDLSGTTWTPISCSGLKFYGNGLTIKNLTIGDSNNLSENYKGFFGNLNSCTVDKLYFEGAKIYAYSNAGVLVGQITNSTVTGCKITSSKVYTAGGNAGLLIGVTTMNESSTITSNTVDGENTVQGGFGVAGFIGYSLSSNLKFESNTLTGKLIINYMKNYDTDNDKLYRKFIGSENDSTIDDNNTDGLTAGNYVINTIS